VRPPSATPSTDAWALLGQGRPAHSTPAGAAAIEQANAILAANRVASTQTLRPDFFHVRVPSGFFTRDVNSFDITTDSGLKLYRMRQAYTADRWRFLDVSTGRSGYTPRFVQIAIKLDF
jgi:hypothetical protein